MRTSHFETHTHTHTHTHAHAHTRACEHTDTHTCTCTHTTHTHTHTPHTHAHTDTHTRTCTHTHQSSPLLRLSSPPTHLMPWQYTSPLGSPLCPSPLDTPTCHWSSSPCWSHLSESLSGWEETSLDRCHTTLLGSSLLRGAISSGEGEGCLGNCKATRVWSPWDLRSCPGTFMLCIQLFLFLLYSTPLFFVSECVDHCLLLLSNQSCCVCVHL